MPEFRHEFFTQMIYIMYEMYLTLSIYMRLLIHFGAVFVAVSGKNIDRVRMRKLTSIPIF